MTVPGRWLPVVSSISWTLFPADFNAGFSQGRIWKCVDGWRGRETWTSFRFFSAAFAPSMKLLLWAPVRQSVLQFLLSPGSTITSSPFSHFSSGVVSFPERASGCPRVLPLLAQSPLFLCHIISKWQSQHWNAQGLAPKFMVFKTVSLACLCWIVLCHLTQAKAIWEDVKLN